MKHIADLPILTLEGTAYERGLQHGEILKIKIKEHIQRWKEQLSKTLEMDADEYIRELHANTDFESAILKWTPNLLDEVKGIADGSGQSYEEVMGINLIDESWWYAYEKKGLFMLESAQTEKCSSLGVMKCGEKPVMVAQNVDLPAYFDGLQTLLHIKEPENDLETLVFSLAGTIGAVGMNSHGVGMCQNTLILLKHDPKGLPLVFVSRGILSQPNAAKAIGFIQSVKHASGQNFVIGDKESVVDYECSANQAAHFIPYANAQVVYHTNHSYANDEKYDIDKIPANSISRFEVLERHLKNAEEKVDVEYIKQTLSSHENEPHKVCVHPGRDKDGISAFCMIMELGEQPKMTYSAGPPCESEFGEFVFG